MKSRINPWENLLALKIWKTKSQYFIWLRGALRKIWQDNPLRKEWKNSQLRPITKEEKESGNFHSSTKKIGQCYLCEKWMAGSKLECDHKEESEGCYDFETAESFLWHCAADNPDNWALACKPCHKIKSYAIRQGITFKGAKAEKTAILLCKEKRDKEWLEERGVTPAGNTTKRREQIVQVLSGEV